MEFHTEFTAILAWVTLFGGFPLCALAALLLRKRSRRAPQLRVLRERYIVATVATFVVLFFGLIFVNNDQTVPWLGLDTTKWITRLTILTLAFVAGGRWIWMWDRARRADKTLKAKGGVDEAVRT